MKGWSCCKKRSTDFTEFLNTPMMKQKIEVGEVERPPVDEPITRLPVSVAPSLEKAFEKALQQMTLQAADTTNTGNGETEVKVGTQCKNTGCQAIEDTKKNCRMDWFQTGPNINISVFSKLPAPDQTYVEVNRITCHIHITFEGGKSIFNQTLILRNAIIPGQSSVKLLGTKVEIMLRKAEAFSWPSLEYKEPSS
ncbi:CHRD1-like protein [Mya arenaria]|uniref:CHRD1-like protein n=1 Tax=Mya arenaria TaxID=6604 RepID=A0ABY7EML6_MYAAR|nr:CHRD1-like protein [Mya arenaria]